MENTLWDVNDASRKERGMGKVLILIIMENTLWGGTPFSRWQARSMCLNPYYNGKYSMRLWYGYQVYHTDACLNPYYNGKYSMSSRMAWR